MPIDIDKFCTDLMYAIKKSEHIFICGNGGSAANAEHFACDLIRRGYRAFALSSNTAVVTMLANDFGYDQIFSKQLEVFHHGERDLLITISCSGTSPNINAVISRAQHLNVWHFEFPRMVDDDYEGTENIHLEIIHKVKLLL